MSTFFHQILNDASEYKEKFEWYVNIIVSVQDSWADNKIPNAVVVYYRSIDLECALMCYIN